MEMGGLYGSVRRCLCALSITKEEIKTFLSIFEKVVMEIDASAK